MLSSTYTPKDHEKDIYKRWMTAQVGSPEAQAASQNVSALVSNSTHSILMPPPNLTGNMHAGHAFQHFLMDTLSRYNRLQGKLNLWYPGVDHAGIQLEGVIDKLIKKGEFDEVLKNKAVALFSETEDNKEHLPQVLKETNRELWFDLAWSKVNEWRDNQKNQASVLGDTPDYNRQLFTLDDRATDTVMYAFTKYWQDGLLYKSSYLINWSVGLQTALSDIAGEIEFETRTDPFVTFEYCPVAFDLQADKTHIPLLAKLHHYFDTHPIVVSTVRPETIFGDVAVALHPNRFVRNLQDAGFSLDEIAEAKRLVQAGEIGMKLGIKSLGVQNIQLIIADEVDEKFGTGALKITPASDIVDYNLFNKYIGGEFPHSVGRDGKLTEISGSDFAGLTVEQGRLAVIKRLAETGFIPVKNEFEGQAAQILAEVSQNLTSEHFNTTDFSYEEGQKRLQEMLGEAGQKLQIDWNYEHNVSLCERSKTVIEPLISEEFFVSFSQKAASTGKSLQQHGLEGVAETEFYTSEYGQRATQFLENIHDWCISRNLVWGHRIPVWYNLDTNPERKFYSFQEIKSPFVGKKYFVFDFDGVVWNGLKSDLQVGIDLGLKAGGSKEQAIKDFWSYFEQPKHSRKNNLSLEETKTWKKTQMEYGLLRNKYIDSDGFFETFTNTIKSLKGIKTAVVSSSYEGYIKPIVETSGMQFDEILGSESSLSKEEKLEMLARKWGVNIDEIVYFTDTKTDVIELVNILPKENIIGCGWGYQGVDTLKEVLPVSQILEQETDFEKNLILPLKVQPHKPTEAGTWVQEEKILDTWFSSCLWPLSTLGFVEYQQFVSENKESAIATSDFDFAQFYSTQEMTTAKEIFYLWIVRMIVLGKYFTSQLPQNLPQFNKIPFQSVIITPTILDEKGRKMSKSLGNGLDPVTQIEKYSADSLRMAMLSGMIPNRNMRMGGNLADTMCEKYRNVGNKLWNVARFLEAKSEGKVFSTTIDFDGIHAPSMWILDKFIIAEEAVAMHVSTYELAHAIEALYHFIWDEFADWYVEYLKTDDTQLNVAWNILRQFVILASPFIPFEAEVLWRDFFGESTLLAFEVYNSGWSQTVKNSVITSQSSGSTIASGFVIQPDSETHEFDVIIQFISSIRSTRGLFAIDPARVVEVFTPSTLLNHYASFIRLAGKCEVKNEARERLYEIKNPQYHYSIDILSYLPDIQKEIARTKKAIETSQKQAEALEKQLQNPQFLERAEPEAITEKRENLANRETEIREQKEKFTFLIESGAGV